MICALRILAAIEKNLPRKGDPDHPDHDQIDPPVESSQYQECFQQFGWETVTKESEEADFRGAGY
tara:strand:- start:3857 stop:4051 length:195 start_codon:yes stop_codon:yes gene_type:complete